MSEWDGGCVRACVHTLSFICVIVCGLFEWKRICAGFFPRLLIYSIAVGDSVIKRGELGPISRLDPQDFCPASSAKMRGDCSFC